MKWKNSLAPVLVAAALCAPAARAQMEVPVDELRSNFIGLGIGLAPDYIGSSDTRFVPIPLFRHQFEGTQRYIVWLGDTAQANLLDHPNWRVGPLLKFRPKRDSNVDDEVVKRMDRVDSAIEGGLFVQYNLPLGGRKFHQAVFGADVESGKNGAEGRVRAAYWYPFDDRTIASIGAGVSYGNRKWMEHYFGVRTPNDIALFPSQNGQPYDPSSGPVSFFIPFGVLYMPPQYSRWLAFAGGRYERLLSDAKDSPIVKERGDENQLTVGIGVAYRY